ncbi:MAG TPA: tRNA lysidine(34) synthetase TilS [Candidatus Acidoferrales bacterium]|nr:tRNA lysidine(34) synthetase TilS [Candidatus Acidoferrales bacterium]
MAPSLIRRIRETIKRHQMIRAGERVAVAVSGGADSIALMRLLDSLRAELGITLSVLHFNHQLRGAESDADETFVASAAKMMGLRFIVERANVSLLAKQNRWNLEDAGRRLRYRFFDDVLTRDAADCVATAHTADDHAETVLTRIIRGTGTSGLAAIYSVRGKIIRPLLDTRRAELRNYLASIHQEWREDGSNADTTRLRARVRKHLLPEMESNFSRSIVSKLTNLAALAREEGLFWNVLVEALCRKFVRATATTSTIAVADLLSPLEDMRLSSAGSHKPFRTVSQRIIRKLYSDALPTGGELSRQHVEQVIRLAESGSSGRYVELPGGIQVRKEFQQLIFAKRAITKQSRTMERQTAAYAYRIELPTHGTAAVSIPELGRGFQLKLIDWPVRERETREEGVVLDTERLRPPLVLRSWKPGDAYCPCGGRRQSLARMLMARRIGRYERALWPVLTSAGRVVWADRMPAGAEFSVSEATQTGLWIFEDDRRGSCEGCLFP